MFGTVLAMTFALDLVFIRQAIDKDAKMCYNTMNKFAKNYK